MKQGVRVLTTFDIILVLSGGLTFWKLSKYARYGWGVSPTCCGSRFTACARHLRPFARAAGVGPAAGRAPATPRSALQAACPSRAAGASAAGPSLPDPPHCAGGPHAGDLLGLPGWRCVPPGLFCLRFDFVVVLFIYHVREKHEHMKTTLTCIIVKNSFPNIMLQFLV